MMKRLCINRKINIIPEFDANCIVYRGDKSCPLDELTTTFTPWMKGKAELYVLPKKKTILILTAYYHLL